MSHAIKRGFCHQECRIIPKNVHWKITCGFWDQNKLLPMFSDHFSTLKKQQYVKCKNAASCFFQLDWGCVICIAKKTSHAFVSNNGIHCPQLFIQCRVADRAHPRNTGHLLGISWRRCHPIAGANYGQFTDTSSKRVTKVTQACEDPAK